MITSVSIRFFFLAAGACLQLLRFFSCAFRFFAPTRSFIEFHHDRTFSFLWYAGIASSAGYAFYWMGYQYTIWSGGEFLYLLVPPYRDIGYFFWATKARLWGPPLVALCFAYLAGFAAKFMNEKSGERFFEPDEPRLFAYGTFFAGYPGVFFYVPLMLLAGFSGSLLYAFLGKGRLPLYYLWLPMAIFAIILENWVIPPEILEKFIL